VSARKTILRELSRKVELGETTYTRPSEIGGFAARPERFQAAVNTLLQERLINGTKDSEGRLAIAINQHRHDAVKRELRPWYASPLTWLAGLGAAAVVVVAILL
jgi:hypothetical protein